MKKPDYKLYITIATIVFMAGGNFFLFKNVSATIMPRAEIEMKLQLRDKDIEHIKESLNRIETILLKINE